MEIPSAATVYTSMKRALAAFALVLSAWSATAAPYRSTRFVEANGIRQHFVDWGGKGPALLLLAGLGNDAYVFDTFAPRFTDRFRVLGLTRRGFGASDKPKSGYDVGTRVEDIRAFLDALNIRRVHLAGHSMAGDELTLFAARYPDRVGKLVYLDAAYDRRGVSAAMASDPSMPGAPRDTDPAAAACRRATEAFRPNYRDVRAPALAFYATPQSHPAAAKAKDPAKRKELNAWWAKQVVPRIRSSIAQFKREMRRSTVIEMPHANHFLFAGATQDEVVAATRAFLLR